MFWDRNGGVEALKAELAKCQPLCVWCHRVKSGVKPGPTQVRHEKCKRGSCVNCGRQVTPKTAQMFDFVKRKGATGGNVATMVFRGASPLEIEMEMAKRKLLCCGCSHLYHHYNLDIFWN